MRLLHYLIAVVLLTASCNHSETEATEDNAEGMKTGSVSGDAKGKPNGYWQKLKMQEVPDGKGGWRVAQVAGGAMTLAGLAILTGVA